MGVREERCGRGRRKSALCSDVVCAGSSTEGVVRNADADAVVTETMTFGGSVQLRVLRRW